MAPESPSIAKNPAAYRFALLDIEAIGPVEVDRFDVQRRPTL
jgi:hypothetical protein